MSIGRGWSWSGCRKIFAQASFSKTTSKLGADTDTRVMLYVGRLSPEKEVDVLIKSFHALQAQQGAILSL
jgi:glycosyltransferase involved in cell wall biosynthesis